MVRRMQTRTSFNSSICFSLASLVWLRSKTRSESTIVSDREFSFFALEADLPTGKPRTPCEFRKAPPLTRPPQGDSKQKVPLAHPNRSLHFYAEIRGFFASPNIALCQTPGRARAPSPPEKAQIGAKGSKVRDSPQVSPVLENAEKHCTFVISNRREVLAKMPVDGTDHARFSPQPAGCIAWRPSRRPSSCPSLIASTVLLSRS